MPGFTAGKDACRYRGIFSAGWETSIANFSLCGTEIVIHSTQLNCLFVYVIKDIGSFGIVIPRLTDGAHIHKILFVTFNLKAGVSADSDNAIPDESDRNVCMAKKAELGFLVIKTGCCSKFVEYVSPALRTIESPMDHCEVFNDSNVLQLS